MDDLVERIQSAIDRPDKPNVIAMHVDDVKALLVRIEALEGSVAPTDGRPCSTDVWLQCAVEQLDDHYDFMEAVKDWLHGDWEGAMECIELPTTHQPT